MFKFKNKTFSNYIELLDYMLEEGNVNEHYFPHSKHVYIKSLLEQKFKRNFTIREVKEHLAAVFGANSHQMKKQ